ncbi:MAG: hypothetical protein KKE20_01585 [Nanoarchaeota archaeon]|nr:hypothetical protein [Nanoarchaeota archaeon]
MKEGNDKLTVSVDKAVKDLFKQVCDKEGLKIGKQLELFMLEELKKRGIDVNTEINMQNNKQKKEENGEKEGYY